MSKFYDWKALQRRRGEIMKTSSGLDYDLYEQEGIAFDYEGMMNSLPYSFDEIKKILMNHGVGNTPLLELKNLTKLSRKYAASGKGARIFVKDEASNPSGSFKARRAALSAFHAKKKGYKGLMAATSGNYGAAVASQAVMNGLKSLIVQECYDSQMKGQPEIIEKARKCEAYGAEVLQLTVGPELFLIYLKLLEETGYFNASLYSPYSIGGVETLGWELDWQMKEITGKSPDKVVITHAGGGNLTGTARGLIRAGAKDTIVTGASVNLKGLHMASDRDFNRKSFTTGHTGFSMPFSTQPDRSDVPRSAARPLRYMDEYVTVSQGEVFYMTEALARTEGLERGPAGNTSLAAAFALAMEMDEDQTIIVQETEYTGAGKHIQPQLSFAKSNGITLQFGDPRDEVPGTNIVFPESPSLIRARKLNLTNVRKSYLKKALDGHKSTVSEKESEFLARELKITGQTVSALIGDIDGKS